MMICNFSLNTMIKPLNRYSLNDRSKEYNSKCTSQIRLGPKMLIGFFSATLSIGLGFVVSYAIMSKTLGPDAWQALGALCGSWMGSGGNMLTIQAALDVSESSMAYALVMDSICATLYVMFLL